MKKRTLYVITSLILALSIPMSANAKSISELKKEKAETQKQLDQANKNVNSLTEQKKGVNEEIAEIDDQLVEVIASVSILEDEIAELKEQIKVKEKEYEEAKAVEEAQYEAMKLRIKFMYEKGDASYVQMIVEAKNLADMVNKADYAEKLYEYDRKMLEEYQKAKQAVADAKAELELEQEELETSMYELEQEKAALDSMMEEKKAEAKDFDNQIAKAKQDAAAYKAKIKQQNNEIKRLEAEEAAKAAAAAAAQGGGSGKSSSVDSGEVISSASGSASGKEVASFACKYVGNPYVPGGTSLTNGCDCSGFTYAVYKSFGYSLPRTSTAQRSAGRGVSYSEAQPGDIICYAGHVALYIGGGRIVHASTQSTGIKYGTATYKEILAVRRIVD